MQRCVRVSPTMPTARESSSACFRRQVNLTIVSSHSCKCHKHPIVDGQYAFITLNAHNLSQVQLPWYCYTMNCAFTSGQHSSWDHSLFLKLVSTQARAHTRTRSAHISPTHRVVDRSFLSFTRYLTHSPPPTSRVPNRWSHGCCDRGHVH